MIKKAITYTNFNDEQVTDICYFNLTRAELIEMQNEVKGGLSSLLKSIAENPDIKAVSEAIKNIILWSYGEKSLDGKRMIKGENHQLAKEFMETEAYADMIIGFLKDSDALADFVLGILPKDLAAEAAKEMEEQKKAISE